METIKIKVSYEKSKLEPIVDFIQKTRNGEFSETAPEISERIEELRCDSSQNSLILYGMMF